MSEDVAIAVKTEKLINCISKTTQGLNTILCEAKVAAQESAVEFVKLGIGMLMKAVEICHSCFSELGIKTRKELELMWEKVFSNTLVRDEVEELLKTEDEWNNFLKELDEQLNWNVKSDRAIEGSPGPYTCPVLNFRTGNSTTLAEFLYKGPIVLVLLRHIH